MNILALDTVHPKCSVAMGPNLSLESAYPMMHTRDIVALSELILKRQGLWYQDLEGIVVANGPSGFTGLRVGLSAALAIESATGVPVVGLDLFSVYQRYLNDNGYDQKEVGIILSISKNKFIVSVGGVQAEQYDSVALKHLLQSGKVKLWTGQCPDFLAHSYNVTIISPKQPISETFYALGKELINNGKARRPELQYQGMAPIKKNSVL